jgi:hypothetical protein
VDDSSDGDGLFSSRVFDLTTAAAEQQQLGDDTNKKQQL